MWKIIKTEIRYHKIAVTGAYATGVLFVIATAGSGILQRMDSPTATWSFMSVVITAYIFLLIHIGSHDETEKRDRLHALLPIPHKRLGVTRMAILIFLQAGFGVIWLAGVIVSGKALSLAYLYYMLSANAVFFLTIVFIAIYLDLGHFGVNTYRWIFIGFWILIALLIGALTLAGKMIAVLEYIFEPYTTPAGAAVFVLIAAGLFYLEVFIYTRRKSYLN